MSTFRSKYSTTKKFIPDLKLQDIYQFPDLGEYVVPISSGLDFLEASKRPISGKKDHSPAITPGWVMLTFDSPNNLVQRKSVETIVSENENFQEEVKEALSKMVSDWSKFKIDFEELNGEDLYQHYYSTERYYENFEQDDYYEE